MKTVLVEYLGPSTEVQIRVLGVTALRPDQKDAAPIEVSEEVAGREPGEWRQLAEGESPQDGWPVQERTDGDGVTTIWTRDLGAGLLAQEGVWRRVAKTKTTKEA